jgi:hypothetical protein
MAQTDWDLMLPISSNHGRLQLWGISRRNIPNIELGMSHAVQRTQEPESRLRHTRRTHEHCGVCGTVVSSHAARARK